jgi:hypothetical protein
MERKPHLFDFMPVYCSDLKGFLHYTCNPPSEKVLTKHGISSLGGVLGCSDSREVLLIPEEVCAQAGLTPSLDKLTVTLLLEKLMRDLQ